MSEMKIEPSKYAFPRAPGAPDTGMSMRDWFAGQALAGFIAQTLWGDELAIRLNRHEVSIAHTTASFSYALADAMLTERNK